MRLLNASTLEMKAVFGASIPAYAILSHTWEDDEITYTEIRDPSSKKKAGYAKIALCCQQARKDGLQWVWIDTCCIDKTSSAELTETLNSMFVWYQGASVCYAYLADMGDDEHDEIGIFSASRWFTRGWTLQELIAPVNLVFFSRNWKQLGTRETLCPLLTRITGIDPRFLLGGSLQDASIAKRMSWAARRVTTREEDIAYCLLGIFGVNMPLLYGEGGKRAFIRLQEEIMKGSDDQSLFAWQSTCRQGEDDKDFLLGGLLAESPSQFAASGDIVPLPRSTSDEPYSMTNKGLRIFLSLIRQSPDDTPYSYLAVLNCQREDNFDGPLAIFLQRHDMMEHQFSRKTNLPPIVLTQSTMSEHHIERGNPDRRIIYVKNGARPMTQSRSGVQFRVRSIPEGFRITDAYPGGQSWSWNEETHFITGGRDQRVIQVAFRLHEQDGNDGCIVLAAIDPGRSGVVGGPDTFVHISVYREVDMAHLSVEEPKSLVEAFMGCCPPLEDWFFEKCERTFRLSSDRRMQLSLAKERVAGVHIYAIDIRISSFEEDGSKPQSFGALSWFLQLF